jgi:hypothetical protein
MWEAYTCKKIEVKMANTAVQQVNQPYRWNAINLKLFLLLKSSPPNVNYKPHLRLDKEKTYDLLASTLI